MAFPPCSPRVRAAPVDHLAGAAAVKIFSDRLAAQAPTAGIPTASGRRPAERGAEMAVAGEAQVEARAVRSSYSAEQVERARQAQAQVVAIQRQALHLLEHLREIHRRAADFGGDLGQRPAPRQIARRAPPWRDRPAAAVPTLAPGACVVRGPSARCTSVSARLSASSGSAMPFVQAVPQQHHQRLRARIDAQALLVEGERRAVAQQARAARARAAAASATLSTRLASPPVTGWLTR